jgi:hypothetical protein
MQLFLTFVAFCRILSFLEGQFKFLEKVAESGGKWRFSKIFIWRFLIPQKLL